MLATGAGSLKTVAGLQRGLGGDTLTLTLWFPKTPAGPFAQDCVCVCVLQQEDQG